MYIDLKAPAGLRVWKGCVINAIEPERILSFDWNVPPEFQNLRLQKPHVIVRLEELNETHPGFS